MDKYTILYLDDVALYSEGAPVIIQKRAIINNNETGAKHVQLKLRSLSNKRIALLKIRVFLYDIIGREVDIVEKQYLDLNVKNNEEFGEKVPILINEESARKLKVSILEVCFHDGTIWSEDNNTWEEVPSQKLLSNVIDDQDIVSEFQHLHGENAQYEILHHKDLWFCSCGYINHEDQENCPVCNLNKFELQTMDKSTMKINGTILRARNLIANNSVEPIDEGIALLESLSESYDFSNEIEQAREKRDSIRKEKDRQMIAYTKARFKKKLLTIIISISLVLILATSSIIAFAVVNNKRKPFYNLRDYAIKNGTYYENTDSYLYLLLSLESYSTHVFIGYDQKKEVVQLEYYSNDDLSELLTLNIDKDNILKQTYEWVYSNDYGHEMEGIIVAKELHNDMNLTYTDTNIYQNSTQELILERIPLLIAIILAMMATAPNNIGATPESLGFPVKESQNNDDNKKDSSNFNV